MCGGLVLEDIELRRNDVAFLDAVGARTIPDPTTEGDYCRRYECYEARPLMGFEAVCMMGIELLVVAAHSGDGQHRHEATWSRAHW
jgi:hypothetical protein